ncbi:histidine kinase CKI1 [Tripterygium wilfordii]|uniref:histidine kinase n=1 Tax=Tripterygium wilfordii TaxID=458696 RepID=A0A7J7CFA5_TRIWF|nr:histidine kinase CKI1 [Tripterygium wilfordii]KAF5732396.1 histidine kinase CKI1 [Tripterygium wilfordii]
MKLSPLIALRPVAIFMILAFAVLVPPIVVIPWWHSLTEHMEDNVKLHTLDLHSGLQSGVENIAKSLHSMNSSAINLARLVNLSLNQSKITISDIQTKVAPLLFEAFSVIPNMSEISYIGLEGLFFSYYRDQNQTFVVYSSSIPAFTLNARTRYVWYTQHVDPLAGKFYGDPIESEPLITPNERWIQEALRRDNGYASLETGWSSSRDLLVLNTVGINGRGVVSLGLPVKEVEGLFNGIDFHGGSLFLSSMDGKVFVEGLANTTMDVKNNGEYVSFSMRGDEDRTSQVGNVSCMELDSFDGKIRNSIFNFGDKSYDVYCSKLEIAGIQTVYGLVFPQDRLVSVVHKETKTALVLLIVMTVAMAIYVLSFVILMVRAAKREMHLCSALIKQMEATQQAERKSMNKSLAFASATHDIRAALAGLTGLIELSYLQVGPGSELDTNLKQMEGCAKDLVGLLNSILDTSKIEAGKMHLEEEEFDVANLLEDVVDLYHPVALKKGVDVVLDHCDGSIDKFSRARGDRGKLKQILTNLLSNAVKFTSEGHVLVRAWVRRPRLEKKIIYSNQNGWLKHLTFLFSKKNEESIMNPVQQNPNVMEYEFEVEDTGQGIPEEKRKSVFENYAQVRETALGHGGTGLGLGIVQSLVRLMGGEIEIVDKENGEKGTCFRFNVFLACEASSIGTTKEGDIEMGEASKSDNKNPNLGPTIHGPNPNLSVRTHSSKLSFLGSSPSLKHSPKLSFLSSSPKLEGSLVVLLIQNEERGRIARKFFESQGIKVSVMNQWEHLSPTLKKIKLKLTHSAHSSSRKSDHLSPRGETSSARSRNPPLLAPDRGARGFILLVIDADAGPLTELNKAVAEFREDLDIACCKVVWLDKPTSRNIDIQCHEIDPIDVILLKPFHGSRLKQVLKFLPEFGGTFPTKSKKENQNTTSQARRVGNLSHSHSLHCIDTHFDGGGASNVNSELPLIPSPRIPARHGMKSRKSPRQGNRPTSVSVSEIQEVHINPSDEKPLLGKRILVAEDSCVLKKVAKMNLQKLGATVEECGNGEEALRLVQDSLQNQRKHNASFSLPYDYILMDCEMPTMNGYEATRQIRKEEEKYGIHIPIIALTAHTAGEVGKMIEAAGMDVYLEKPLKPEHLLEAIRYIHELQR